MMKRLLLLLLVLATAPGGVAQQDYAPQDGDIIFHTSRSDQSQAIQLATASPYSHMGIVFLRAGQPEVFEAVQPVKSTPLDAWVERGVGGRFVVKRLRDATTRLTPEILERMLVVGSEMAGQDYDLYFEWSDDRIYCSELVWKIFDRAVGIQLGRLQTLKDFDLSHPLVAAKIEERFDDAPPADEMVISPVAIFDSPLLVTVHTR